MNEKFITEPDPRQKPCVSIDFGASGHVDEYVLILRPNGIYGAAADIPSNWQEAFSKLSAKGWNIMNRGSRFEIKPPFAGEGIFSRPIRTDETDRAVEEILRSVVGEKFELNFSPSKK